MGIPRHVFGLIGGTGIAGLIDIRNDKVRLEITYLFKSQCDGVNAELI